MTDEQYMELAIEEGRKAKASGEWPFGAVIVRGGEIVAQNRCTESATKNVVSHAELQAVSDACIALGTNKLDDCTIYDLSADAGYTLAIVTGVGKAEVLELFRDREKTAQ